MKVFVSPSLALIQPEIKYVLALFGHNKKTEIEIIEHPIPSVPSIGLENEHSTICVSRSFLESKLSATSLDSTGHFRTETGRIDLIATAFYCVTAAQEIASTSLDALERFQYQNSYQSRLGNIKENVVQRCFDQMAELLHISSTPEPCSFFLSHDMDSVHGGLFEDGFNVAKKGRIDILLKFIWNSAIQRPDWLNVDKILKIENEYDCRSTFFWIVNQGKVGKNENADYDFHSKKIQKAFSQVVKEGGENGLHKSLSNDSFQKEISKFGTQPFANRYHYLKFNLPRGFDSIEESNIKLDASLGFSEQFGFRNNYGLPFNPFDFKNRKAYSFVEVPLHVMDRTFFHKRMPVQQIEKEIFDFFENHQTNCVISVLWHNNFFTEYKYKGYLSLYKKILAYIRDHSFQTMTQQELFNKYNLVWR